MNTKDMIKLGSDTAKGGFRNEDDVVNKFNNWKKDADAKKWLVIMGYVLNQIERVEAVKLPNKYKADVNVKIIIYMKKAIDIENISVKLVSNASGSNQIDKRPVDKYKELWNMPDDVAKLLKFFTGEIKPYKKNTFENDRMYLDEMSKSEQEKILTFFSENRILIVSDIFKGRGPFSADWLMVTHIVNSEKKWILKSINQVMNFFGSGDIKITEKKEKKGLKIGRITVQRKGGTPDPTSLQFKINPVELFGD